MDNKYSFLSVIVLFSIIGLLGINLVFAQTPPPNGGVVPGSGSGTGSTSVITTLTSQLCGIVNGVRTVIGVIALVMFLIGGVLYAVGHFMPAAGQIKASMQGWAMGMILGGVIGVVLVILAPFIISTILNFGSGLSALAC